MRRRILEAGAGPQEITDWLNEAGIKPGPYVKKGYWSYQNVVDLVNDPILSGTRTFRKQNFKPIYRTGRHRRLKNPNPELEQIPELAHMGVDEQMEMIAALEANSRRTHDPKRGRAHPLYRKPRTDSIFPAQHAECAACGGRMHRALKDQIKCRCAHRQNVQRCWNHVQVQCELARKKIFSWFFVELDKCPQRRTEFLDAVWSDHERELARRREKLARITGQVEAIEEASANLATAIAAGGNLEPLLVEMRANEVKLKSLRRAETDEACCLREEFTILSREELDQRPLEGTLAVARRSPGFAGFLRHLFPRIQIVPVQSLDHGLVRPRARILVSLAELSTGPDAPPDFEAEIDLFDPPLHIQHIRACLAVKSADPSLSLKQVGSKLQIGYMTVKRSFDYARKMARAGVQEPYVVLSARPDVASRWK